MTPQTKTMRTNHGEIAYWDSGEGGPVVLLIHGNSSSKRIFEKQFKSALATEYRLIAPDLPGHGESGPAHDPQSTYYIAGFVTALIEFLNKMEVDGAHLAGWSLGGHIALELLARWGGTQSAFIFGTPPLPLDPERALSAFHPTETMGLTFAEHFSEDDARAFVGGMVAPPTVPEPWMIEDALVCDGRTRAMGYQAAIEGKNLDEEVIVRDTAKPLAVLHGEHDAFINLDFIQSLTMPTLWDGEVKVLQGVGHTPQWEAPEAFNEMLLRFLAEAD